MRALDTQFELFDTLHLPTGDWNRGKQQGSKLLGQGSARKYKNSGNEAKKYLKTNDITFFMLQIARILHANLHKSSAETSKTARFAQIAAKTSEGTGEEWK